jgi:oligoendopeptidase F
MDKIKAAVKIAQKLQKAGKKHGELGWTKYTAGYDFGLDKAYNDYVKILKDKKNYEIINGLLQKSLNPDDKRRIDLLKKAFEPFHLSDEINKLDTKISELTNKLSGVLNTHRNKINGKDISTAELYKILSEDDKRSNRKKAYLSLAQVNKPLVENGFLELIKLRNEYAKLYGHTNYVEYALKRSEIDCKTFDSWKPEIKKMSGKINGVRNEYGERYLKIDKLEPWDGPYLASKIAPLVNQSMDMSDFYKHVSSFFLDFGFDISKYNITYDIYPRKNKSEWGYYFSIDSGNDVRILANATNKLSDYYTLLHETGHAVHGSILGNEDLLMQYGVSDIISEGFANFFGKSYINETFYKKVFDKKMVKKVEEQFKSLKKWRKINEIRNMDSAIFDQELYKNKLDTLDDINQLMWKLEKELWKNDSHEGEPVWGHTIHHTTHPIILHSYFMGDVTLDMMQNVFMKKEKVESIAEKPKQFGNFMADELIKPSGRYTFDELFKRISGEKFSLKFLND